MERDMNIAKKMLDVLLVHENSNVRLWAAGEALDLKIPGEGSGPDSGKPGANARSRPD